MILTFDLYGTLVDWRSSIGGFLKMIGIPAEEFFSEEFRTIIKSGEFIPYSKVLVNVLRKIMDSKSIEYRDLYGYLIVRAFAKSPFFPDALIGLKILKEKHRTGIISNTEKSLANITLCGLEDMFDFVITAEETGYYKPDERAFMEAWKRMGAHPSEIVHISSYPQYDLITAHRLGVRTVLLNRYGYDWKESVNNLIDLERII